MVDRAWPKDESVGPNRVDVCVARLRKKIEPNPAQPAYIHTVRGVGYYFRPPSAGGPADAPRPRLEG